MYSKADETEPAQSVAKPDSGGVSREHWNREHWTWIAAGALALFALLLRAHDLHRIFFWLDEADFFNEHVYGASPQPLLQFARATEAGTTNTWGWPVLIWLCCRAFGATLTVARLPSLIAGAAAAPLVFLVALRVLPASAGSRRYLGAGAAGLLAACSVVQMDFSQRTMPYGGVTAMSALILLAHFHLRNAIRQTGALLRAGFFYVAAGIAAVSTHPSLVLLLASSFALLVAESGLSWRRYGAGKQRRVTLLGVIAAVAFAVAILLDGKNSGSGYRYYLTPYYHGLSPAAMPRFLFHAYDLAVYHLNLFYRTSLYWPQSLNPVVLPLVALCVLGWVAAVSGRLGGEARHGALFAAIAVATVAVLSLARLRIFPFAGVRQTLHLSVFFFLFAGLGFYVLLGSRITRHAAWAGGVVYAILWSANLPRFYADRLASYIDTEVFDVWQNNGRLPVFVMHGDRELHYALRHHPEIPYVGAGWRRQPDPSQSFLLMDNRAALDDPYWDQDAMDRYRQTGHDVVPILIRPAKHPESWKGGFASLYFPPSGLWIYKITPARKPL